MDDRGSARWWLLMYATQLYNQPLKNTVFRLLLMSCPSDDACLILRMVDFMLKIINFLPKVTNTVRKLMCVILNRGRP